MAASSDCRQRLIAKAAHHGFEIVAYLLRKAQPFDDGRRPEKWQDANVIKRELAVDRRRAFDQAIELLKLGHQRVDMLARPCTQLDQIAECLLLPHDVVIVRGNGPELRQAKKRIPGPS